jgi:hypothetical protein
MPLNLFLSRIRTSRPGASSVCLLALSIFLLPLILPSCALVHRQGDGTAAKETDAERNPRPGDLKTVDGAEYIYGSNRRFPTVPGEPEYVWVRRDQYSPRLFDSLGEALVNPSQDRGEMEDLERRISKLEEEIKGRGPTTGTAGAGENRPGKPSNPVPDAQQ